VGRWFASEPEVECLARPVVCSECVRALALEWWGGIARHAHGDPGTATCVLCELGAAAYCAPHFLAAVTSQRRALRANGTTIGEPAYRILS
jgi:hypothetical protein